MSTLVSLREFARLKGWNPGYAHKLKAAGRLVMEVDERDREMVDVEASLERLAQTADPSKTHMQEVNARQRERAGSSPPPASQAPPAAGPSANATFNAARTAREVYEAKSAELEYRQKAGELVRVEDVRNEMAQRVAQMREHLLSLSARLAPVLANESDPRKIKAALDAEHRHALMKVAGAESAG